MSESKSFNSSTCKGSLSPVREKSESESEDSIRRGAIFERICLFLANPVLPKIVETDASDLGYGGILKQIDNNKEHVVQYVSAHWNDCQKNYSTIKKEILSIVLCISKFQRAGALNRRL